MEDLFVILSVNIGKALDLTNCLVLLLITPAIPATAQQITTCSDMNSFMHLYVKISGTMSIISL